MARDTLTRLDQNGDGKLAQSEFIQDDSANEEQHGGFRLLDKNGDGHLDAHELVTWESGMAHVESAINPVFTFGDEDNDNLISAQELANVWESNKLEELDAYHYLLEWVTL